MTATAAPSHNTAKTQLLAAAWTRFAYRRFGRAAELPHQHPTDVATELNQFLAADDENMPSSLFA